MLVEITSWLSGKILFSLEAETQKSALQIAVQQGAQLQGADLRGADLQGADLQGAYLRGAQLHDAQLQGAHLRGADLQDAQFQGADLTPIRDDLWAVLSAAPAEVQGLRQALIDGRIDGAVYQGDCACLIGTLANVRGCKYDAIPGLTPSSSRPAERWFLLIHRGATPAISEAASITPGWVDTWLDNMRAAFGTPVAGEEGAATADVAGERRMGERQR